VLPLVTRVFEGIAEYAGEVPGARAAECGNYLSHDLGMAAYEARRYLEVLRKIAGGETGLTEYPPGGVAAGATGFVFAMRSELEAVLPVLPPLAEVSAGGRKFLVGPGVFAILAGVGELAAAAATEALIWYAESQGAPLTRIVNAGVCGSLATGRFAIGEPLVVEKLVHYEFDISGIDDLAPGQYPGEPGAVLPLDVAGLPESLTRVVLASGDKFCSDPALAARLVQEFGAEICEMEGAGVYRTATRHGIPVTLVKTISDEAGTETQAESYWDSGRETGMSTLGNAVAQVLAA
jgi:nucleoside phosphorylase